MEGNDIKMDGKSLDVLSDNINKLKELFPEVFTEGKVDFEELKETLGEYIDDREERYNFTWNGKSQARLLAQTPSTGTLRPCPEESVDWDTSQNLFIEGDNLEVLKLLQKSYHRKVKMIYIDPPYNTGNDFIYPDNFRDNINNYLELTGQTDDEGRKISTNAETSGRYHTDWLNMMYPRLKLARNLLTREGVIFISIDDHEVFNLRKLCDEIFGEENFIATFIWEKRKTRENRRVFSFNHDFILCYAKNKPVFEEVRNLLPATEEVLERYSNPDNDPRGDWQSISLNAQAGHATPTQFYKIKTPSGRVLDPPPGRCWSVVESRFLGLIEDNRIWFGQNGNNAPRLKSFKTEAVLGLTPHTLWKAEEVGTTDSAKKDLISLFGGENVFDTPKPVELIKRAIQISTNKHDIIIDFFSGSCPTAEAALTLNVEDHFDRKHIMIQLQESCAAKSEAKNAGYDNIAEIGKERIRRVIAKIKEESPEYEGDLGFKVFKLDSTNIKPWEADIDTFDSEQLETQVENIKPDRQEADIIYEILLKYGLDLTLPIEERTIAGKKVFIIGLGALIICLADNITIEVVEGIAKLKEELTPELMRVVFKDNGFPDDVVKTNTIQILRQHGIDDVKSL